VPKNVGVCVGELSIHGQSDTDRRCKLLINNDTDRQGTLSHGFELCDPSTWTGVITVGPRSAVPS